MLLSVALILLVGMLAGWMCSKMKLPNLLGMILTGILLGPYVLNVIDNSILQISADIRKVALVIILTRAGLTLNLQELKKVGRPAIGGIPLAMGLSCGNVILTVAVLSIFITAPLGAFLIDLIYKKLLMQSKIAFFFPFSSW